MDALANSTLAYQHHADVSHVDAQTDTSTPSWTSCAGCNKGTSGPQLPADYSLCCASWHLALGPTATGQITPQDVVHSPTAQVRQMNTISVQQQYGITKWPATQPTPTLPPTIMQKWQRVFW